MADKRCQKLLLFSKSTEFGNDAGAQIVGVKSREVSEPGMLCVAPDSFVGIQLGGIRRKFGSDDATMLAQKFPNDLRSVVDVAPIPNDRHRTVDLPKERTQKINDVFCADVFVIRQKLKIEPQSFLYGAQRDSADGGDSVSAVPAMMDRCLTARRERTANHRSQHEP